MLGDDVDGKIMLVYFNVVQGLCFFIEGALDFPTRNVFVMEDSIFWMSAFFAQIVLTFLVFIKSGAPVDDLLDTKGSFFHHHFYYFVIAEAIAGIEGIGYVFVVIIDVFVPNSCYPTLGVAGIALWCIDFC